MRVITPAAWRVQPWRNGRGTTHEIVRWPDSDDPAAPYDVRVSLAEVSADGPFSTFPGQRRWSFLAGSAGVDLTEDPARAGRAGVPPFAGATLRAPGDHVALAGEVPVLARLVAGPAHLLNVLATAPVLCGHGPTVRAVRCVVALVDTPALPRWHAGVLAAPALIDTTGCAWIA